jgi:hypothetical protein
MEKVYAAIVLIALVSALCIAPIAWLRMVYFGYKAISHARPGVALWGREMWFNPANVLVLPGLLDADGLHYRRKCFVAAAWFGTPILATFAIAYAGALILGTELPF